MGKVYWTAQTSRCASFLQAASVCPRNTLIASDFDGTLAPIVDDPQQARLLPEAAEALSRLGPVVQLAIITGREQAMVRQLGGLDQLPGLERLVVLGHYGAQRWDAATGQLRTVQVPDTVQAVWPEAAAAAARFPGATVEDKGLALAIHTRRAADPVGAFEQLRPIAGDLAAKHHLKLEPGRLVLELRAATISKGDALRALVDELGVQAVAMCGDDLGDLPAFDALDQLAATGLTTCAVVSGSVEQPQLAQRADVVADGPRGVAHWLSEIAIRCGA